MVEHERELRAFGSTACQLGGSSEVKGVKSVGYAKATLKFPSSFRH